MRLSEGESIAQFDGVREQQTSESGVLPNALICIVLTISVSSVKIMSLEMAANGLKSDCFHIVGGLLPSSKSTFTQYAFSIGLRAVFTKQLQCLNFSCIYQKGPIQQ